MLRPGGAVQDLPWTCPEGFVLETVVPDRQGGLFLISASSTLYLAKGKRKPTAVAKRGSGAGAACLGIDGSLLLGNGTEVHRVTPKGKVTLLATGFGEIFGIAVDRAGRLHVSDWKRGEVIRMEGTKRAVLAKGLEYPSGLAFDTKGRLYVKESGRMTHKDMRVRRADAKGKLAVLATIRSRERPPKKDAKPPAKTPASGDSKKPRPADSDDGKKAPKKKAPPHEARGP